MWEFLFFSEWITSPRDDRDLLMLWASFIRVPSDPLLDTLSLPARSTRLSLPKEGNKVKLSDQLTVNTSDVATGDITSREKSIRRSLYLPYWGLGHLFRVCAIFRTRSRVENAAAVNQSSRCADPARVSRERDGTHPNTRFRLLLMYFWSWGFRGLLARATLQLVVGNLSHAEHYL